MDSYQVYKMNEPSGHYSSKGCNIGCLFWLILAWLAGSYVVSLFSN